MANGFKADAQGFLVGELLDNSRDLLRAQEQGLALWRDIRTEVANLSRALGGHPPSTPRKRSHGLAAAAFVGGAVATPAGRRGIGSAPTIVSSPVGRQGPRSTGAVAVPARGGNGRFVAGSGGPRDDAPGGRSFGMATERLNRAAGALAGVAGSMESIDATMAAAKEVTSAVAPLGRGLSGLFGRNAERKKERWYGRFLTALKAKPKTEAVVGGGRGGGLLSGVGQGVGAAAGGRLAGMLGKGGKLLRRLPVLGALMAGGGALASMFGGGSREEKYGGVGEAGGMLAGGLAGAKGGAMLGAFLGPVGVAVGGLIGGVGGALFGEVVGKKVGEWTMSLVDADIPGKIVAGWNVTSAAIGGAWDSLAADARMAWTGITDVAGAWWQETKSAVGTLMDTIGNAATAANDWIKQKTGIDVKQAASDGWSATKAGAGRAWDGAKGMASDAADAAAKAAAAAVPNTIKRAAAAGGAAATQAKAGYDEARGKGTDAPTPSSGVQRVARSAGGAVGGAVNAGSNAAMLLQAGRDAGMGNKELANFMGQNAHESGNLRALKENTNFTPEQLLKNFKGRNGGINNIEEARAVHAGGQSAIGEAIYGGAWGKKNLGNTEAGDGLKFKGRGFTQITGRANYTAAGKDLGLDLVNNPALAEDPANAARISAWYWKKRVASRGAGEDVTKATKLVNGGYNGLADRQAKAAEWGQRLASGALVATTKAPTVPSANVPSASASQIPPTPEANIPERLNNTPAAPVQVNVKDPANQDVRDRRIAQVVSGGISP
ncbi:MAG: hypothetical protein EOP81_02270 [Variovorax sp.]|nr:MAG: hypothetical protein EOP81_02270 [Variovorax sp.]